MGSGCQKRLTFLFRLHDDIGSSCATSVDNILSDSTAQNVHAVSCYSHLDLCDGGVRLGVE